MSFADIINQTAKQLEQQNNSNEGVKYPQTKHKRLFYEKNQKDVLIQVLPSADLVSAFAEQVRKIFLSCKSSNGKEINANFTLDAEPNEGSLLEQKIAEWSEKGMIPNGFGGQQSPKRVFLVNTVNIIQNPANPQQWVQQRDEHGNLVVRTFEMPQSAFANLIRKLQDPLLNTSGTELSFMDPNRPAPIKVSKPAKGQMEYPVEVYTAVQLPPLGVGWESQLENLKEQAVPTERLENGYEWVQAFVDMKEGRKPNQHKNEEAAPQPQVNPYDNLQSNPYAAPQPNPYATAPQPNPYANVQPNPYATAPQPNPYATAPQAQPNPYDISGGIGEVGDLNNLMPTGMNQQQTQQINPATPTAPAAPTYTAPVPPAAPTAPAAPTHNIGANDNGLMNIDAMLEKELNGGI